MAEAKTWSDIGVVDFREIVCGALRVISLDKNVIKDFAKLDEVVRTLTSLRNVLDDLEDPTALPHLKEKFLRFIEPFGEHRIL